MSEYLSLLLLLQVVHKGYEITNSSGQRASDKVHNHDANEFSARWRLLGYTTGLVDRYRQFIVQGIKNMFVSLYQNSVTH